MEKSKLPYGTFISFLKLYDCELQNLYELTKEQTSPYPFKASMSFLKTLTTARDQLRFLVHIMEFSQYPRVINPASRKF